MGWQRSTNFYILHSEFYILHSYDIAGISNVKLTKLTLLLQQLQVVETFCIPIAPVTIRLQENNG